MSRMKIKDVAVEKNERVDTPSQSPYSIFVGLEHYDSGEVTISRHGTTERLESTAKVFHSGDILIARRNVYLKRAATVVFDGLTSGDSIVLHVENETYRRIIPFVLNTDAFWNYANQHADGSMSKRLSPKLLMEYEFSLPDDGLDRIADLLWAMNDTKKAYRNLLAATDELVKARFVEMFGDPESNPFGWKVVTLKDVCSSIVRGPFGSSLKKSFFVPRRINTYKVYEQKNAIQKSATIGSYYITEEKYQELKRFECVAGDFIMSCSGTMGEFYQLPVGCEKGIINQALCKFTLNNMILPSFFLTHMAQTISNLETRGSSIKNVAAVSTIIKMPINLPPIEKQKEFELFLNQVRETADTISNSQTQTEVLINSVIHNYLG